MVFMCVFLVLILLVVDCYVGWFCFIVKVVVWLYVFVSVSVLVCLLGMSVGVVFSVC